MHTDFRKLPVYFSFVVMAALAVGLAACGDEDSDFSPHPDAGDAVLSFDDLSNCTAKKAGALEFVKDTPYVCVESGDKFRWEKVSQTEDEPEDFKVCNQKREGQYALSSSENILYVCSDEEWAPLIQINDDASSSSGKEGDSSSSASKSSDSGKDAKSSSSSAKSSDSGASSSGKDAKSSSESSSSVSSSSGKSSSSGGTSSSVSSSSVTSSSEVRSSSSIPSSFSTGMDESAYDSLKNTLTDYRDGQIYRTTAIEVFDEDRGIRYSEVWMAQNLNYAYLVDTSSFCPDDQPAMCDNYGRYYTWAAAMDSAGVWSSGGKDCGYGKICSPTYPVRGVCPKGWHLPGDFEWNKLITALGGNSTQGRLLKSTSGWFCGENGTDGYGFSALPSGGYGRSRGRDAMFWSSTAYTYDKECAAYYLSLSCYDGADIYSFFKTDAFSVRCIKDVPPSSSSATPKSSSRMVIESSSSVNQAVVDPSTVVIGSMIDERDGQTYGTVTIGEQTWMAENLKFSYKADPDSRDSSNFCFSYSGDCIKYGRYYTWASAMDSAGVWSSDGKGCGIKELCTPTLPVQGVCPSGWHLPSNYDWQVFLRAVGGSPRKVSTSLYWKSEFGTNEYRFYARPGGFLSGDRTYMFESSGAYFWSSAGFYLHIDIGNTMFLYQSDGKENVAYNVRCIKD